ncbi:poly-beta-1,6-N-acetyl-D-glucosamine biosynthesis protein PgaD [Luteibacter sp. ME-Dv--P-043b]|uniref:poly-beta-1,6-N-acetyl-D-glucosamine biosynthesis protein PgaD n=1 Tax=Luteibacter sp. ME-Dv--P-043b TaxID=3040291 RepID=UPI0025531743|nr:poly-beta-1,6-N-acetyl-D-glucosamine biosynthesis protein PgaD [Luteibacter sp. ME-Dv--P-043b]
MKAEAILIQHPERQSRTRRTLFGVITIVAWLAWAFLWLPLFTFVAWVFGVRSVWLQFYVEHRIGDGGDIDAIFLVALLSALTITAWSTYNRARFTGRQKRRGNMPFGVEQTATRIGASAADAVRLQAHRRGVIDVADDGRMTLRDASNAPPRQAGDTAKAQPRTNR